MNSYSSDLSYPFEVLIEDFILGPYVAEAVSIALSIQVSTAKQLVEDYWRLRIRNNLARNSEVLGLSLQEVCSQEARRLAGCADNLLLNRAPRAGEQAVSICEGMGQNILGQVLTVIQETQPSPQSLIGRRVRDTIYRSRNILEGCRQLDEDLLNMLDQVVYEQSNREVYTDDIEEIHSSDDFFVDDPRGEEQIDEDYY